jgi:hypothetical protein
LIKSLDHTAAPPSGYPQTHAILALCLTGQENGRAIQMNSPCPLWILETGRAKIATLPPRKRAKIRRWSPLGGWECLRGARRGPQHLQEQSALKLPAEPQGPGRRAMTAEVAVMNKSAVALAADSKVTVGSQKTYDTVNKIFTLSKVHPIGIMIYGNADFMEYPWETIVKLYRAQKKTRSERTVEAWGEDFWRFVRRFGPIRERERINNIEATLSSVFQEIDDHAVYHAHLANVSTTSSEYQDIVLDLIQREIDEAYESKSWTSKRYESQIVNKYWKTIIQFTGGYRRGSKLYNKVLELSLAVLLRHYYGSPTSGIVISGFGTNDIFPTLATYNCAGYIGSQLKLSRNKPSKITMQNNSSMLAFAQGDIVYRFMEGVDRVYANVLRGLFRTALIETNLATFAKWAPKNKANKKAKEMVEKAAISQYDRILSDATSYREQRFIRPTLDMASILPKDELAQLAESLVALTSLHRRVSREMETVGGAIDVAVISKSEGFIWIKRKHYFKRELNPQFDLNYMRDVQGERR